MKKFGKAVAGSTRDANERKQRRARSEHLPEPDQNPLYKIQAQRSDEDTPLVSSEASRVVPTLDSVSRPRALPSHAIYLP